MIDWPSELIKAIALRKSVLYLGSGISANSIATDGVTRPPTWEKFLQSILIEKKKELTDEEATITKLLCEKDYLTSCEIIVDKITETTFGSLAATAFRSPGFRPAEIHEQIYNLDSRIVITPNVDKIYEQYASNASNGTVVVKKYNDNVAEALRSLDYLLIKAHGCVDHPDSLVFTQFQYNEAKHKYPSFYKILEALLLTNTFIFLGCGYSDPDIQLTMENINFSFSGCSPHFFVTDENFLDKYVAKSLLKNRNIKILTYSNPDGKHENLLESLRELNKLVDVERSQIASEASW